MNETLHPTWGRCFDFLNIFDEKFGNTFGFLLKLKLIFAKKYDHNIAFYNNAENCQKSPKIVIVTSTPVKTKRLFDLLHLEWT
jgi:hypothetical protein